MHLRPLTLIAVAILQMRCATLPPAPSASSAFAPPDIGEWTRVSSQAALAAVANDLECPVGEVTAWQDNHLVLARGCQRMVYFEKQANKTWARLGPRFELTAEDDFVEPDVKIPGPVQIDESRTPPLSDAEWRELIRTREAGASSLVHFARADCIVRADGTLHHCLVTGSHAVVATSMHRHLRAIRVRPVMLDGHIAPRTYRLVMYFSLQRMR